MIFLPIAERELRVATRNRATFWLRMVSALAGMLIGSGLLVLHTLGGVPSSSLGSGLFGTLTWLSFFTAISAGVFLTSDSVCEEKRAGTLGFLFLTDLRGYDVVFGKLAASSLKITFALLALMPILGLTLLMGGVSGGQFWRTCLALLAALLCSLVAGLFVSTISREPAKAVSGTILLILGLLATGPLADFLIQELASRRLPFPVSATSPGYAFVNADSGGPTFWEAMVGTLGVTGLLFVLASLLIRRVWQQKERSWKRIQPASSGKFNTSPVREGLRRKLMDRNPFLWLASRDRWQASGVWTLAAIAIAIFAVMLLLNIPGTAWVVWNFVATLLMLLLYVWTAAQASRFFVEARRNGLMELMLATPMREKEMVHGQWLSLTRTLGPPVLLILLAHIGGAALAAYSTWGGLLNEAEIWGVKALVSAISGFVSSLAVIANLVAIAWFGMWMGMTSKTANHAAVKTLLFVQVIPWFAISFLSGIGTMLLMVPGLATPGPLGTSNKAAILFPLFAMTVPASLTITKDVLFFFWARNKLHTCFREQAGRSFGAPKVPLSLAAPQAAAAPAPPLIRTAL